MPSVPSPARRAIVIGLDGASMELVRNLIEWGHVPNIARVYERAATKAMLGVFPTLTPPGWTAIATGSWPGTHGVMDFNIHEPGQRIAESTFGIDTGLARSEYFWNTVERAGRIPILVKWEMAWPPTVREGIQVEGSGPGVANFHQIAGYHLFTAGRWAPRPIGGDRDPVTLDPSALQDVAEYDVVTLKPAEGWASLPSSGVPPLEAELVVRPLGRGMPILHRGTVGTPKPYYGLVYGDGGYERVRVTRSRDGGDVLADLGVGEWSDPVTDEFEIDGETVDGVFRLKLIGLSDSADELELFVTQIWPTGGDYAVPGGTAEELYEAVGPFIQNPGRDALGFFDDDTYFELLDEHHLRLADYAVHLGTTRDWDVLFTETHAPDYASHFFLGQADPISGADGATLERCRRGLERTWQSIDRMIGRMLELADEETVVAIVSDHGGTPSQHAPVEINEVLREAGLLAYAADSTTVDPARTKALGVGLVHVFVNLSGREPDGIVDPADCERVQQEIVDALLDYRDPATGERPFTLALSRADAEVLNLSGDLVGDVVYALKPGYDGAHGKQLPSVSFGIAGQHSTFILAGPGVKPGELSRQVRAVDVIPTIAYLLGLPMPADVEGGVVYEALEDPNWPLTELARLADLTQAAAT